MIAAGLKTIETRSHDKFRCLEGQTIAIHAAKAYDNMARGEVLRFVRKELYAQCLSILDRERSLPTGAIVCTVRVVDARPLDSYHSDHALCNCLGKFGLFLTHARIFYNPLPFSGKQGIFTVPDECLERRPRP